MTIMLTACSDRSASLSQALLDVSDGEEAVAFVEEKKIRNRSIDQSGLSPLQVVLSEGRVDLVEALISTGSSLDYVGSEGITTIIAATMGGMQSLALIPQDVARKQVNIRSRSGLLPLSVAMYDNDLDAVRHLLTLGADVSLGDANGVTPLHTAVMNCSVELIKLFSPQRGDLLAKSKHGVSPFDLAQERARTSGDRESRAILAYLSEIADGN